jgi:2-polyprenyl-6-methoxyphenol hydroxylase-like FAD-dependent oxidoreductase
MTHPRAALVIGGGVAGPVAAMALQRAGIQATGTAIDLLSGSETSQRLHTIWHDTVLRIDFRTAR